MDCVDQICVINFYILTRLKRVFKIFYSKTNVFVSYLPPVPISMLTSLAWNTHINTGLVLLYNWPRTSISPTQVLPYPHILDLVVKD